MQESTAYVHAAGFQSLTRLYDVADVVGVARVPEYIEAAGFDRLQRLHRLRTVGGTFEIHRAATPLTVGPS